MNWLQKTAQIPATQLESKLWYHGTDSITAYRLMNDMLVRPRSETGNSSYEGSISSIPSSVYLTSTPGKAAKHAIESSEQTKGQPVILVIQPERLGFVHVDEDLIHMMLNGHSLLDVSEWYPSPNLEAEIFEMAAQNMRLDDWEGGKSDKQLVLEHIQYQRMHGGNEEVEEEYLQEEGIIPDAHGNYEYDESMHVAKDIAAALNDKHQQEAIMNYQSMAHQGKVQASEIYLIPWQIQRSMDDGSTWRDSPTSLKSYEELSQFGNRIDPKQLLMPFMKEYALGENWLQKTSQTEYPLAGSLSNELQVLDDVPNTESIHAGFESENDYRILPGIREIPMWDGDPHTTFYAANDIRHSRELAVEIQQSGMIKPLIVGIDLDGNDYLIEGVHRFVALHLLGKATFPAMVVVEQKIDQI